MFLAASPRISKGKKHMHLRSLKTLLPCVRGKPPFDNYRRVAFQTQAGKHWCCLFFFATCYLLVEKFAYHPRFAGTYCTYHGLVSSPFTLTIEVLWASHFSPNKLSHAIYIDSKPCPAPDTSVSAFQQSGPQLELRILFGPQDRVRDQKKST